MHKRLGTIAVLLLLAAAAAAQAQSPAAAPAPAAAQPPAASAAAAPRSASHLGVSTCGDSNCHSAAQRLPGSTVPANEYLIWSKQDKHRDSYKVLLTAPAIRIAKALGLPDAANQKICLDCHSDFVPVDQRGPQYHVEDGVGCEACHGAASAWLGTHISGTDHKANIAAGMYPTEQPIARGEKCLSCHYGDDKRFVDHRFYRAGHPRLTFELATFTRIQPAHYVPDPAYIARKGKFTDVQVWATGQAVALERRMAALIDPQHAPRGLWPEFALFDCQSCHHQFGRGYGSRSAGHGPGTLHLNDANGVMVRIAAEKVAPDAARALAERLAALNKSTGGNWSRVQSEAAQIQAIANSLKQQFANHNFTGPELKGLAAALIAQGASDGQFSHAEQTAMALDAVFTSLRASGDMGGPQGEAAGTALQTVRAAFSGGAMVHQDAFVRGLRELQRTMQP